jgi:hypothetical protein
VNPIRSSQYAWNTGSALSRSRVDIGALTGLGAVLRLIALLPF